MDNGKSNGSNGYSQPAEAIDLLGLLLVLARYQKPIAVFTLGAVLSVGPLSLLLPDIYTGTTRILPPQQEAVPSFASVLGLGGLAGGSVGKALGLAGNSDLYVGILSSRTVADRLISRFELQRVYEKETLVETREKLREMTEISAGKDEIISVSVEDSDPKRAAAMANAYADALAELTRELAIGQASRRRAFLDKQLQATRQALTTAENAFKKMQESTGVIQLDAQARALINAVATVRAEIAAREVELRVLQSVATPQNPEYIRLQEQLAGLRRQAANLERQQRQDGSNPLVASSELPGSGLEYARKFRNVQYYEKLFEFLAQQLEQARLEEANDATQVQVLDRAIVPDKKTKPQRALLVAVAALVALVLGGAGALVHHAYRRLTLDPVEGQRLQKLRELLPFMTKS